MPPLRGPRRLAHSTCIQIVMCHFMFLSNIDGQRWILMGVATKMALTVSGLIKSSHLANKHITSQLGLRKAKHTCGLTEYTDVA